MVYCIVLKKHSKVKLLNVSRELRKEARFLLCRIHKCIEVWQAPYTFGWRFSNYHHYNTWSLSRHHTCRILWPPSAVWGLRVTRKEHFRDEIPLLSLQSVHQWGHILTKEVSMWYRKRWHAWQIMMQGLFLTPLILIWSRKVIHTNPPNPCTLKGNLQQLSN